MTCFPLSIGSSRLSCVTVIHSLALQYSNRPLTLPGFTSLFCCWSIQAVRPILAQGDGSEVEAISGAEISSLFWVWGGPWDPDGECVSWPTLVLGPWPHGAREVGFGEKRVQHFFLPLNCQLPQAEETTPQGRITGFLLGSQGHLTKPQGVESCFFDLYPTHSS